MSRVVVISAGLGVPSSTRLLADMLAEAVQSRGMEGEAPVQVQTVELRPLARGLADALVTGFPTGELADALSVVAEADALVAVTPVFSASYSGLFKMFFDALEPEALAGKPVVLAATAGTARHSLVLEHALRPLFSYLKAVPVPTAVFAASEDFGSVNGAPAGADLQRRVHRAAEELTALLRGRPTVTRRERSLEDRFEEPTPFAELLARR